jgi:hypothetical protein
VAPAVGSVHHALNAFFGTIEPHICHQSMEAVCVGVPCLHARNGGS